VTTAHARGGPPTARPVSLSSTLALTHQAPAFQAAARISGTLDRIDVQAHASAHQAQATANATVTPFASGALEHVVLNASNIDPQYFLASAPSANLAISITAERETAGERLRGALAVTNDIPGTLDRNRVPVGQPTSTAVMIY
jgi:hypothetical protein